MPYDEIIWRQEECEVQEDAGFHIIIIIISLYQSTTGQRPLTVFSIVSNFTVRCPALLKFLIFFPLGSLCIPRLQFLTCHYVTFVTQSPFLIMEILRIYSTSWPPQVRAKVSLKVESQAATSKAEAPIFVRNLNDQAAKVGTRVRFLVELRQAHDVKVRHLALDKSVKCSKAISDKQCEANIMEVLL